MRKILSLVMLLATTACAGQSALRSTSAQTAVILDQYRTGFRTFASSQSELNNQIETRIGQLQSMRTQREGEIKVRVLAWALADDKPAQQQYALLTDMRAEAFLTPDSLLGPAVPSTDPSPPKLAFDAAAIDGVVKQLVELQKPQSARALIGDLLAFGSATYEATIAAAAADATDEAKDTKTDTGAIKGAEVKATTASDK